MARWLFIQRRLCQGCYCPQLLKGVGVTIFDKHLIAINWREKRNWTLTQWGEIISELVFLFLCFWVLLHISSFLLLHIKGQLISIWLIGVFNFFQKMNENKSTWGIIVVKLNSFVHFLEEFTAWQFAFEFYWLSTYWIWSIPLQFHKKSEYDFKEDINPLCSTMVAVSLHLS